MKKNSFMILSAAVAALFAGVSCEKVENAPEQKYELSVKLAGCAGDTKATGSSIDASEAAVSKVQVFVFRGDFLDAYATSTSKTLSVSCTAGARTIYAVANGPDLSNISSLTALKSKVIDLSDNTASSFVMAGSTTATLPGTKSVSIEVSRLVSRVVVKKITRDFTSASLEALTFKVDKIYLVDVAGNTDIQKTAAPSKWYNDGEDKSELPALLKDAPAVSIADGDEYTTSHYFYAMPNSKAVKTTKLVIEATLGTAKYYYPISLPALESNKSYEITNIKIQRPGSDDPDTPVSSDDISFSITVAPWVVSTIAETII